MAAKRAKWSEKQIKEQIQKINEVIKQHRRERKEDERFAALTPEQIRGKLKRVNSPMFVSVSWISAVPPGGTFNCYVTAYNPDPTEALYLFAQLWVGSGNIDPDVSTFMMNADLRFPRLTEPKGGLWLASNDSYMFSFGLKIPSSIEQTTYFANSCLMHLGPFEVGDYLDRAGFDFAVS